VNFIVPIQGFAVIATQISLVWLFIRAFLRWRLHRDIAPWSLYLFTASLITITAVGFGFGKIFDVLLGEALWPHPDLSTDLNSYLRASLVPILATTIVALPMWVFHWKKIQQQSGISNKFTSSDIRRFYLYAVISISALISLQIFGEIIQHITWLFLGMSDEWSQLIRRLGRLIPALVLWAYHWQFFRPVNWIEKRTYLFLVTAITLIAISASMVTALELPWKLIPYDSKLLAGNFRQEISIIASSSVAVMLSGSLGHIWHRAKIKAESGTTLQYAYLLFATGIATAAIFGVITAMLFNFVASLLGDSSALTPWEFLLTNNIVSITVVGIAILFTHIPLLQTELNQETSQARIVQRLVDYTVLTVGLIQSTYACIALSQIMLDIWVIDATTLTLERDDAWWMGQVSAGITFLIVGILLLLAVGPRIMRALQKEPELEKTMWPRRCFYYIGLTITVVFVLFNSIGLLQSLLAIVLGEPVESTLLTNLCHNIINLIFASILLGHFAQVTSRERAVESIKSDYASNDSQKTNTPKLIQILTNETSTEIVATLQTELEQDIHHLGVIRQSPESTKPIEIHQAQIQQLIADIQAVRAERVLIIIDGSKPRVIGWDKP